MREAQSLLSNRLLVLSGGYQYELDNGDEEEEDFDDYGDDGANVIHIRSLVRCSKHPCSASPCTNGGQCSAVRSLNMHIS